MNNKLYVGNISFKSQESDLEEAFSSFGTVKSVKIVKDFESGRSKGFGFVEMENEDQANECISNLDGKEIGGRALRVSIARDKKPGGGRPQGGNRR